MEEPDTNEAKDKNLLGENWMGPDGTESGPDVPEDWYLSYGGPAPVVDDIYGENYGVDRGNGVMPIQFYVKKWGIPKGFEEKTEEAKDKNEPEKLSSSGLFRFYAIVLGWVGLQIYLLYESDFDFHVTFPIVTLHLTLLYLSIKQGWFRRNE
ncbi:hypothetical protein OAE85_01770 [Akkermansiaceae bacterium]|nr:hypothetical protein [Akkermansiaceae bacterium]